MQKFDSLQELLPNMEHYHEEFQQLYATPKGLQKMKNPVGRQKLLQHIPFLSDTTLTRIYTSEAIIEASSQLLFHYIASEKNSFAINRLTGQPFEVSDSGSIDIFSGFPKEETSRFDAIASEENRTLRIAVK